jgi:hypothetical protein
VEQDPSGFGRGVREEVAVLQAQMDLLRDAIGTLDTLYDAIAPSMAAPQVLAGSRAR